MTTHRINLHRFAVSYGEIVLASVGDELCLCDWSRQACAARNLHLIQRNLNAEFEEAPSEVICRAQEQLEAYFACELKDFSLPLRLVGTPFQKRVWEELMRIPYGELTTYKAVAQRVGNAKGVRAVAQAIGANRLGIIVPCHRVVGSDGSLTGFASGLETKRMLLTLEGIDCTNR